MVYKIMTDFNLTGREVFRKKNGGYCIKSLNGDTFYLTKEMLIKYKDKIVNLGIKSNGAIYCKNSLESFVFSWWLYYGKSQIIGKQVIGRVLSENCKENLEDFKKNGYDGVIIKNAPIGMKDIRIIPEEYIALYPNQIKSIYNKNPKLNNQIFDSDEIMNLQLSEKQIEFFKNTKIRTENNLKVCYHSTLEKFETFDMNYIGTGHGSSYGEGFYFSSEPILEYGDVMKVFLNIKNPYIIENVNDFYNVVDFLKNCGVE